MQIRKSAEDYLETMLMMQEQRGYIRSIDIANHLGVTKPSVSYAVKNLRENGYISMDKNGELHLLPPGLEIAERIYERHQFLTRLLVSIGVDEETAEEDACKLEHDLSEVSFAKLKEAFKDI